MTIEPSEPQFVFDLPLAVIESVLSEQARFGDDVYLTRTELSGDDQWVEWVFMLFPDPSAIALIETSCR